MSSPQQPRSPGRTTPSAAEGRSAAEAYGAALFGAAPHGAPQVAPQGHGAPGTSQAPQPYGSGAGGELVLTLRKPFGAMGMISPVVTIDGHPAASSWGRNSFRVPAGVRQVDVAQTYLWTYGRASQPVNVQPGSTSEIFYSGPMWTFGFGGAVGTEPQRRPGTGLFIAIMVFLLLLAVLIVLAVVLAS